MDTAKIIETLLEIQDHDLRIFNLERQILSVPAEKEKIRQELQASEDGFERAHARVIELEKMIKRIELDIGSCNARIQDLQKKALVVKKNDEYRALMNEVEHQKKLISDLEDGELQGMDDLDVAKTAQSQEEKALEAARTRIESAEKDLDVRGMNCSKEIEKVRAVRNKLAETVPKSSMQMYTRLMSRSVPGKEFFRPITPVQGETCGGCFLKMTPNTRNRVRKAEWVTCENCGRILYFE